MATIKVDIWEINPQSGSAGEIPVAHKMVAQNTGRNKRMKQIRASVTNPGANASAIETLEAGALPPFLSLNTPSADVAYSTTQHTINGESNAERFRITTTAADKNLVLKPNAGYTIVDNVGTFSDGFGLTSKGVVAILVEFTQNSTTQVVSIPVKVEIWNGTDWVVVGTYAISQGTADSGVTFVIDPEELNPFGKDADAKTVSINSSVAYTIEKQGSVDVSWLTLSRNTGIAGTANLDLNVSAQAVGAPARNLNVVFKNSVTGSVVGELAVSQVAGEAFAISWESETISFANDEVGEIKTNTLTANADWALEEVLP